AVIEARRSKVAVYREIGRTGLLEIQLCAGFAGDWDHRFRVEVAGAIPPGLTLRALGETGRVAVGATADLAPPGALAALPAVFSGDEPQAVPSLGWSWEGISLPLEVRPVVAERLKEPPLFPDYRN